MASGSYEGHPVKRQKMEDGGSGYNDIHNIDASKVVHVRGLPEYANEDDIVQAVQHFGHVDYVLTMPKRHQALVEFRDMSSSRACVTFANTSKLLVGDFQIFVNFSTSQKIQRNHDKEEGGGVGGFTRGPAGPHNILLFTVVNAQYPITVDVMHTICSPHGKVEKIVIFKKQYVQSMVQFDNPDSAKRARDQLHGCDIYSGCCTLRIEYARASELNVKANNTESWDYTTPLLGKAPGGLSQMERRNPPLLADPRYAPAPTPYAEMEDFGGDVSHGYGQQRPNPAGRGGAMGGYPGQYDQSGGGFDTPYIPAGRGAGRGVAQSAFSPQGRPGAYGGGEGWNQEPRGNFGQLGGKQDVSYGGGGYGQSSMMGQQGGFMEQQGTNVASGGLPAQGCVVMVYGLDNEKMNCDKVFNLFCLYGNVIRVKFLRSKEGAAMVQLGDSMAVERSMFNLNGVFAFGKKLNVTHSKQAFLQDVTNPHNLPDGTSSFKDFMGNRNNRFTTPESAAKNRILHPTEIVHYYNAPPKIAEEDLRKLFEDNGVNAPSKILQFQGKSDKSSNGLLEWDTKAEACEALCLVNHASVPHTGGRPYILKLCFSQSNIRK